MHNPVNVYVTADSADALWFSQRDRWRHLYRYDARTGALKNRITQGEWLVREIVAVDEARHRIYFTASGREGGNPYYRYLYRVNFDGTELLLLSPEKADHLILPDKTFIADFEKFERIAPSRISRYGPLVAVLQLKIRMNNRVIEGVFTTDCR